MNISRKILIISSLSAFLIAGPTYGKDSIHDIKTKPDIAHQSLKHWTVPTSGKIIAPFSSKEDGNPGVNIAGVEGQPIVAAADGKVLFTGNALKGYGNLIIIQHNDVLRSAYSNNQKILVKENQFVKEGQTIATMGDKDNSPAQLHFEIRKNGNPVDPTPYLSNKP